MSIKNLLGAVVCVMAFVAVFVLSDGGMQFLNLFGLLIVLSGTLGAALLSHPIEDLKTACVVAFRSYTVRSPTAFQVIDTMLRLSVKSRRDGIIALQDDEKKTEISFLKNALGMMVDGFDQRELKEILFSEMRYFQGRRERHERVFRHMGRLAPAFGVAGSVVGLIGMLAGIGDTTVLLQTIPLALTSTLYGILLCNFVLIPIAESIHFKTQREVLTQRLIVDAVLAMLEEKNSLKLERRLTAFLTPSERVGKQRTFAELRQRYLQIRPLEDELATWGETSRLDARDHEMPKR